MYDVYPRYESLALGDIEETEKKQARRMRTT
jgi:hypothetical protein